MRELSVAEKRYLAVMAVIGAGLSISRRTENGLCERTWSGGTANALVPVGFG
jgi:hypothetical protein